MNFNATLSDALRYEIGLRPRLTLEESELRRAGLSFSPIDVRCRYLELVIFNQTLNPFFSPQSLLFERPLA
jgi:hypothetical protein